MDVPTVPKDVDQIGVVVDWLDACRQNDIEALLDLYARNARLQCECEGGKTYAGRTALESYWRPRLDILSPNAFELEAIVPFADGAVVDFLSFDGKPVRIVFRFDAVGKILATRCEPSELPLRDPCGAQN